VQQLQTQNSLGVRGNCVRVAVCEFTWSQSGTQCVSSISSRVAITRSLWVHFVSEWTFYTHCGGSSFPFSGHTSGANFTYWHRGKPPSDRRGEITLWDIRWVSHLVSILAKLPQTWTH